MSDIHDGKYGAPRQGNEDDLEQLLLQGVTLQEKAQQSDTPSTISPTPNEDTEYVSGGDIQGALGLFAEAAQDMATTSVELGLGRHFACADFCNQAAEKAAQSVSMLRFGHRSMYNHDLRALGILVGAPQAIQDELAKLTPFHPEDFYIDTPPEEADEIINAEQASSYIVSARKVMRWAKSIVLSA